jgi:hypothetical protein
VVRPPAQERTGLAARHMPWERFSLPYPCFNLVEWKRGRLSFHVFQVAKVAKSVPKRTSQQREDELLVVAEMHAKHRTQREIAAHLGVSHQQICKDLKEIYRRWAEPDKPSLAFYKARMLAKIRFHEKRMEHAWLGSLKPKETVSKKQVSTPGGVSGEGEQPSPDRERNEASLRTEERDGNPAFLHSIEWCMEQEIKLRGLDAPQVLELEARKPLQFIRLIPVKRGENEPPPDPATGAPPGTYVPLAKVGSHEKLARGLLADSRKPKERHEVSLRRAPGGVVGEGEAAQACPDKDVVSKKHVTESQSGNPAYLKSIEWCMDREIKLRGLDAPQKLELEARKPIQFIEVHEVRRNDLPPGYNADTGVTGGPSTA